MINILEKIYNSAKEDLVIFYMQIEDHFLQDFFTILFFILIILGIVWIFKNIKEFYNLRKDNRKIGRNIEKSIVTFLSHTDKNKKNQK